MDMCTCIGSSTWNISRQVVVFLLRTCCTCTFYFFLLQCPQYGANMSNAPLYTRVIQLHILYIAYFHFRPRPLAVSYWWVYIAMIRPPSAQRTIVPVCARLYPTKFVVVCLCSMRWWMLARLLVFIFGAELVTKGQTIPWTPSSSTRTRPSLLRYCTVWFQLYLLDYVVSCVGCVVCLKSFFDKEEVMRNDNSNILTASICTWSRMLTLMERMLSIPREAEVTPRNDLCVSTEVSPNGRTRF